MSADTSRQSAWTKRRAEAGLVHCAAASGATAAQVGVALHPERVLAEQTAKWRDLWTAFSQTGPSQEVSSILSAIPPTPSVDIRLDWSAANLLRATKAMAGKSGGADDWLPDHFLLLPTAWWDRFAKLWSRIYDLGVVPTIWKSSRVTLVRKANGSFRPISLSSVAWRAGSRYLCQAPLPLASQCVNTSPVYKHKPCLYTDTVYKHRPCL